MAQKKKSQGKEGGMKKMSSKKVKKVRGVFEKVPSSGVWWIRFIDADGALRREKVGSRSGAIALYGKRKPDAWQGKKLPKKLRARMVRFSELADDYLAYAEANNLGKDSDKYRTKKLKVAFGDRQAEIPIADLREWFNKQEWEPATYNRCRTVLGLIYKLGIENKKVDSNPARLLKRQREPDGRVRFLNQFEPDEESRLRKVILDEYPKHMPEFDIALNTGLRRKEQYRRIDWSCVDFLRGDLFVPESKNGASRHIRLNADAMAAFKELYGLNRGDGPIFVAQRGGEQLLGARHWFEDATMRASIRNFTWHDVRHTFASRLVMAGVDLRTVADLMGHKRIQMTMRYAHLAPAHKQEAVEKLSAFNARERQRQKADGPAILTPAAPGEPTDTRTDTDEKSALEANSENVQ
jgi:integrase